MTPSLTPFRLSTFYSLSLSLFAGCLWQHLRSSQSNKRFRDQLTGKCQRQFRLKLTLRITFRRRPRRLLPSTFSQDYEFLTRGHEKKESDDLGGAEEQMNISLYEMEPNQGDKAVMTLPSSSPLLFFF